jgi:hypothetical protein
MPPPTEKYLMPYLAFSSAAKGATFSTASTNGPTSVSCEPMCICTPFSAMFG